MNFMRAESVAGLEDQKSCNKDLVLFMRTNVGEDFSLLPLDCPVKARTKQAGCK